MNEAWLRAVRIQTRAQAQSAAAMCPQDHRMACLEGCATMLLLMLLLSWLRVCFMYVKPMWFVGRTD